MDPRNTAGMKRWDCRNFNTVGGSGHYRGSGATANYTDAWRRARYGEPVVQARCRTADRRGRFRERRHVVELLCEKIRQLAADKNRGIMHRSNFRRIAFRRKCKLRSRSTCTVGVENVADVIDMWVIDQQNVHAPKRSESRISGALNRSTWRDQHTHTRRVFEKQRTVSGAEFASLRA